MQRMWGDTIVMRFFIKQIIFLSVITLLSACNGQNVSFEKPLRVILTKDEISQFEKALGNGNYLGNDFNNVFVFEGILESFRIDGSGELIYQFRITEQLSNRGVPANLIQRELVDIVSPSLVNGGVDLTVGKKYRVAAPLMPDSRLAIWKGVIIKINAK